MSLDDIYLAGRTMNLNVAEELHEAESSRLARIATAGRDKGHRFYCGVLAWFGTRLISWGQRLQERYSGTTSSPVARPVNRLAN
jgi:hypothetical protein